MYTTHAPGREQGVAAPLRHLCKDDALVHVSDQRSHAKQLFGSIILVSSLLPIYPRCVPTASPRSEVAAGCQWVWRYRVVGGRVWVDSNHSKEDPAFAWHRDVSAIMDLSVISVQHARCGGKAGGLVGGTWGWGEAGREL